MIIACRTTWQYHFTFKIILTCQCSPRQRTFRTANEHAFSEIPRVKEQKKLMFKCLGDDQLEESVRKIKPKLLFNSYIKFGLDIPTSYRAKQKYIQSQYAESKIYDEVVKKKSIPISLKFLQNNGKINKS